MSITRSSKTYAVILAGGGGTRLWPKSTNARPKQFLAIGSTFTLLQNTYNRLKQIILPRNILVVSVREYVEEIRRELPEVLFENILIEPSAKNTAGAIALAIWEINKRDPNAVIGSFASDHLIRKEKEFVNVLGSAYKAAGQFEYLLTVGILPTKADIGLGYIHVGSELDEVDRQSIFKVKRFLEKPDISLAKAIVASGEYFWNASYFIGKISTFLQLYQKHLPETLAVLKEMDKKDEADKKNLWERLKSIAVDYAIMEKAGNLAMIPGDFGWSDVGNWAVLSEVFPSKDNGNVYLGKPANHLLIDSKNCLIYGNGKMIATIGVSDLIIVETKDAILICQKNKAQEVKDLVETLKREGKTKYL